MSRWIEFGDRNSKYFHGIKFIWRKKNWIKVIQDDDGNWIGNFEELENYVMQFYKNIFSNNVVFSPLCISHSFSLLEQENVEMLGKEVTNKEILYAIRMIEGFKALGLNRFLAVFYQSSRMWLERVYANLSSLFFVTRQRWRQLMRLWSCWFPRLS